MPISGSRACISYEVVIDMDAVARTMGIAIEPFDMNDVMRCSIAVVDDDYRILESLESLLESAGHIVHLFPSAEAFLEAGILVEVDCLISDVGMPGMDGFELLRLAQRDSPGLTVILITGREELIHARPPVDLSPQHFFTKPFDGKKLLTVIAEAIQPNQLGELNGLI